jgi:hypothetical protein
MFTLDTTTKSIEVLLAVNVTTNQLPIIASWADKTSTTFTPGSQTTQTNNTTAVTAIPAPAASTQREGHSLNIYNEDTASATVTVRENDNGTFRKSVKVTLAVGDVLMYSHADIWKVMDSNGQTKIAFSSFGNAGGDLTGTYPNPTIAKIQGTTISGTTGTGNVALSASPTFTGTPTIPNVNGSYFGAYRNKIIGGDFGNNPWVRGTSFAAIADGAYSADRWKYNKTSAAVHTILKDTDVPTVAQAGRLVTHSVLVDCTTADASVAAGDIVQILQHIEGYNAQDIAQRIFTLSFWHKHTKTGTYCVSFRNSGTDRSYVAEYTQTASDVWEFAQITVTASPSAGTWDYTNGIGMTVGFTLMAGSTFQTTANTWQTGNFIATSNQVNAADSTANNFRLALVQVEPGIIATPFEGRGFGAELSLCQRYYVDCRGAAGENNCSGTGISTQVAITGIQLPVDSRSDISLSTFTIYNNTTANQIRNILTGAGVTVTLDNVGGTNRGVGFFSTSDANIVAGTYYDFNYVGNFEL